MRLDRYLAHATGWTRKEATKAVKQGRVWVDGALCRKPPTHVEPGASTVELDGATLRLITESHLLMHKPAGVVSATRDPLETTVVDLVPDELHARDLSVVGRLDKDTTGLLVLTTDGAWSHRLTHPKHKTARTYVATVVDLAEDAAARFADGLILADKTLCQPAELIVLPSLGSIRHIRVRLREGRYHQVRRMVAACGGRVLHLHREAIGALPLPGDLPPGACRPLEPREREALLQPPPPLDPAPLSASSSAALSPAPSVE